MDTFVEIGNLDLRTLADDELNSLINGLAEERARRYRENRERDWNKLIESVRAYIKKYTCIEIITGEDNFYIDDESLFDTIGQIELT